MIKSKINSMKEGRPNLAGLLAAKVVRGGSDSPGLAPIVHDGAKVVRGGSDSPGLAPIDYI
jgi:hypothetical protein